jgi:glutamate synthase (ferredoxin)
MPKGMTFVLEGDANDYFGKGLSGGKLILFPPAVSTFVAEENMIVGNVCLYGATGGEVFIRGMAGERFGVRNSGVRAVVEAIGDHGCEYMTGGIVAVLGPVGRNFAAGMSGGVAYLLDEKGDVASRCNAQMVGIEKLDAEDLATLKAMIENHAINTKSTKAARILADWANQSGKFVKVMPKDYKRMLEKIKEAKAAGLAGEAALIAAFEANSKDKARVGGG